MPPVILLHRVFLRPPQPDILNIIADIGDNAKHRREKEVEKLKYQKEILELEIEKENLQIKSLEAENKRLDRIIDGQE